MPIGQTLLEVVKLLKERGQCGVHAPCVHADLPQGRGSPGPLVVRCPRLSDIRLGREVGVAKSASCRGEDVLSPHVHHPAKDRLDSRYIQRNRGKLPRQEVGATLGCPLFFLGRGDDVGATPVCALLLGVGPIGRATPCGCPPPQAWGPTAAGRKSTFKIRTGCPTRITVSAATAASPHQLGIDLPPASRRPDRCGQQAGHTLAGHTPVGLGADPVPAQTRPPIAQEAWRQHTHDAASSPMGTAPGIVDA